MFTRYNINVPNSAYQSTCDQISGNAELAFWTRDTNPSSVDVSSQNPKARIFDYNGYLNCISGSPGTLTMKVKWGSTVLASTGAIPLPSSGLTNAAWNLKTGVIMCTPGTSGKINCQGYMLLNFSNSPYMAQLVNAGTGTAGQITVNTQTLADISITAQFSVSNSGNVIVLSMPFITQLN